MSAGRGVGELDPETISLRDLPDALVRVRGRRLNLQTEDARLAAVESVLVTKVLGYASTRVVAEERKAAPTEDVPVRIEADRKTVWLRLPEVMRRTGLSKTSIYRRGREGTFPKRTRIDGRVSAWLESDVENWCRALMTEDGKRPQET